MAIQLEKENNKFNIYIQHFLIDSAADLQTLESEYTCHQGDKAELPDGSYYLRHSNDYQGEKWELANSSSGGSGSSDLPPITSDDDGSFLVAQNSEWGKVGGYGVSESTETVIPEQMVTTQSMGSGMYIAQNITGTLDDVKAGTSCIVNYNGNAYNITAQEMDGNIIIGEIGGSGPSFDNYPFIIGTSNSVTQMYCNSANPTISVDANVTSIVPSDDFISAVTASKRELLITFTQREGSSTAGDWLADVPYSEVTEAIENNVPIRARYLNSDGRTERDYTLTGLKWNQYQNQYTAVQFGSITEGSTPGTIEFSLVKYSSSGITVITKFAT